METVVDQLLEIDRKARQSIDEAQQYYDNTMKEIEIERQRVIDRFTRHAEERIEGVRVIEEQAQAESSAEIQANFRTLEQELNGAFEKNHEAWESEMFRRILGKEV